MRRMCEIVRLVSCHHKPTCKSGREPLRGASVHQPQLSLLRDRIWQSRQGRWWEFKPPYSLEDIYICKHGIVCLFFNFVFTVSVSMTVNIYYCIWMYLSNFKIDLYHFFAWLYLLRVMKTLLLSCDLILSEHTSVAAQVSITSTLTLG